MAGEQDQERTEQATPKKREEARKKGQVAQSKEIPSVMILLSGLTFFYFAGNWMFVQLSDIPRMIFQQLYLPVFTPETAHAFLGLLFKKIAIILSPLLTLVIIAGLGGSWFQSGFLIIENFATPKFSKLNPVQGIKRLISVRSLAELVKSLAKFIVIGTMAYVILRKELDHIPGLLTVPVMDIMAFVGHVALKIGFYTCIVLLVLAGGDFLFQKWQHERDLRMTKQEVKDEYKQREGDPQVRSRIKAAQRKMAMQRMMEALPEATVVITNPTHLAVALKFDQSLFAPMVVAKGAGHVAQRIKEIANAHDIPIMEQKPLARALFKDVEIGQYIPADLYHAVAEILAYVYRLKGLVH